MRFTQKKRSSNLLPWFVAGLLSISFCVNIYFLYKNWERNIVVFVPDGDSLELRDGRRIRLLGVDAPEEGACMADQASSFLNTVVYGHHIHYDNVAMDTYGRTLAHVTIDQPNYFFVAITHLLARPFPSLVSMSRIEAADRSVNVALVAHGMARYTNTDSVYGEAFKAAQLNARDQKLGIWSDTCHQTIPPDPACDIKGNVRASKKTYLLPECKNYDQTIIDQSYGDQWLCSEVQAIQLGFSRASGCVK